MDFRIFYSWQTNTDAKYNRSFILSCIEGAVKKVKQSLQLKDSELQLVIDRDTKNIPGSPEIMNTIRDKINNSDIFIGDVSVVNKPLAEKKSLLQKGIIWLNSKVNPTSEIRPLQNTNVFNEHGIAREILGLERIISVLNSAYGDPTEDADVIPFDTRHLRWPISYEYSQNNGDQKEKIKQALINDLANAIKSIIKTENIRQRDEFTPFEVYTLWEKVLNPDIPFVGQNILKDEIEQIRKTAATQKQSLRVLGLSAIGKTRLVFEALSDRLSSLDNKQLSSKVLYVDCYIHSKERIIEKVKELVIKNKQEMLIVADNCDFETFKQLNSLLQMKDSKLSLISIFSDPDERDRFQEVQYMALDDSKYSDIINEVLTQSFPELSKEDREKIKELCHGLTQFAILIAKEIKGGNLEIRNVTDQEILKRIVGALGNTPQRKGLLMALSIFIKVGYYEELNEHFSLIISDPDIVGHTDVEALKVEFDSMCEQLRKRGLLEKEGRYISIRPKPVAIALATEWWQSCSPEKALRIIQKLQDHQLGQLLCDQMKYLSFLQEARENVKNLCGENAPFGSAEVLKTDKGSRLFRSLVEVNPEATLSGLEIAFRGWSVEKLKSVENGRRNLIWALEKLCFREELFERASKTMASFALAENEPHISNNATGQFLHLFQIQLAGTQANLQSRLNVIKWLLTNSQEHQLLAVKTMGRALMTSGFTRMMGAEQQGSSVPLRDYQPSGKEIYQYWQEIISILSKMSAGDSPINTAAQKVLFNSFGGLAISGGFELVYPYLNQINGLGSEEWKEVRSVLLRVKKFHFRFLKPDEQNKLNELIKKYSPNTLSERYLIAVSQPSLEDLEDYKNYNDTAKSNAIQLAEDVVANEEVNDSLFPIIYKGQQQFGYYFGRKLSELLRVTDSLDDFLFKSIKYIEDNKSEVRIPVLGGLLSHLSAQSKTDHLKKLVTVLSESDLFWLFSILDLPISSLNILIDYFDKYNWNIRSFLIFKFGTGIRHLDQSDVIIFLDSISKLAEGGPAISFQLAYYFQYNEPSVKDFSFKYIEGLMLKHNLLLMGANNLDGHAWQESVAVLVKTSKEESDSAKLFLQHIVEYCSKRKSIIGEFDIYLKNTLIFFKENYFTEFWLVISAALEVPLEKSLARWNLKQLLQSHMGFEGVERSVLFNITDVQFENILAWCRKNPKENAPVIAEMVYLYEKVGEIFTWHRFAKKIIDEFGMNKEVLSSLSANIGTYGWSGSIVPLLARQKKMFEELLSHKIPEVVEWADKQISYLSKNIKEESYRDEEWGI